MRIAFTHNLQLSARPEEAEFDTPETVAAVCAALHSRGHDVERLEVSGPASRLVSRLEALNPDLILNTAEGRRGRFREAFYPALFDELGFPYTGSDAYALTLTLDKAMTKRALAAFGVPTPRGRFVVAETLEGGGLDDVSYPVIVKPNFEGSSKGITQRSVAEDSATLARLVDDTLAQFPAGVLVEQYIPGADVSVPFLASQGGVLDPVEYIIDPAYRGRYDIYDYVLKNEASGKVEVRSPARLAPALLRRIKELAARVVRALEIRDFGRVDFRVSPDGEVWFLECNALPSLEAGAGIFAAAAVRGLEYADVIHAVVSSAAARHGLDASGAKADDTSGASARRRRSRGAEQLRVGFTYNMKRIDPKEGDDRHAEYDSPKTIDAITKAIESYGHKVVQMEATSDLPRVLMENRVDVVFNMAEGIRGRNREAQVPSLCELLGIPYTNSDPATLSLALDKGLGKRILRQHGILTPHFQVFNTGRERILKDLRYPVIVKPNAEGSSKGITARSVVDDEEGLRRAVLELVELYDQPAIAEEYITGREFTVGLLGERRPRILPPMEIVFLDPANARPVYDFSIKLDFEKKVEYRCPAELDEKTLKEMERVCRDTFMALECRDVARVDLRMDAKGHIYVIEVNPLPGLTPDWSDLVLIAKGAGMDYRTLIGEILSGAIKRLKEQRREALDLAMPAGGREFVAASASGVHAIPPGVLAAPAGAGAPASGAGASGVPTASAGATATAAPPVPSAGPASRG